MRSKIIADAVQMQKNGIGVFMLSLWLQFHREEMNDSWCSAEQVGHFGLCPKYIQQYK